MATRIMTKPEWFKICYGCTSIMPLVAHICPLCHHYKWNKNTGDIRRRTAELKDSEPKHGWLIEKR